VGKVSQVKKKVSHCHSRWKF